LGFDFVGPVMMHCLVALLRVYCCSSVHLFLGDVIAQSIKRRTGRPRSGFQQGQDFSLLHIIQTGLVAHSASYKMGTGGGCKAALESI
jgi:hypothetical protein